MPELKRCCPDMPDLDSIEWIYDGETDTFRCPYCDTVWNTIKVVTVKVSEGG